MDSFETVIASILQRRGYWTLTSVKVELTKDEKRSIGRHSSPRWELDVVAYRGADNELRVVECKSFLDSPGVHCGAFDGTMAAEEKRYKLFCDSKLRQVVFKRLEQQLVSAKFCRPSPIIKLCLAAGKIRGGESSEKSIKKIFDGNGWILLGPNEIRKELRELSNSGYENNVASIVAKLLLREGKQRVPSKVEGVDADV